MERIKTVTKQVNGKNVLQFVLTDEEQKELGQVLRREYCAVNTDSREAQELRKLETKNLLK